MFLWNADMCKMGEIMKKRFNYIVRKVEAETKPLCMINYEKIRNNGRGVPSIDISVSFAQRRLCEAAEITSDLRALLRLLQV
jgi:hypothetical protein